MLTPFDDHDVTATAVRISGAGAGLQDALDVAPVELHLGDRVHIVLRGVVRQVIYQPLKDSDELRRVHVISTVFGTIGDEAFAKAVLAEQQLIIEKAKGVERLPIIGDGDGQ